LLARKPLDAPPPQTNKTLITAILSPPGVAFQFHCKKRKRAGKMRFCAGAVKILCF